MNTKPNDGGPAFPCEGGVTSGLNPNPGMSLRDWFAGQALAARWKRSIHENEAVLMTATLCYQMADAMLAARDAKE